MKKKLLIVLFPLLLVLACSLGVWANEQSTVKPGCGNCVKTDKTMPCGKSAQGAKAGEVCEKCAKLKAAEGKPCASKECGNCAKLQQAEVKPCCNKTAAQ